MGSKGTHHESYSPQERVTGGSDRSFGFVFAALFLLIGLWSVWNSQVIFWWSFILSGIFEVLALFYPRALSPLNQLWTLFGAMLHKVMTPLILAVMFFLVFAPMGLFLRMVGKRLLSEPDPEATSYWIERDPPGPDPTTMPQQF